MRNGFDVGGTPYARYSLYDFELVNWIRNAIEKGCSSTNASKIKGTWSNSCSFLFVIMTKDMMIEVLLL